MPRIADVHGIRRRDSLIGALIAVSCALVLAAGLLPERARAAMTPDGLTYERGESGVTITGYEGTGTVDVPAKIDGAPVTAIGEGAFALNEGLTEIRLPEGVRSIGVEAFNDCVSLTSVLLPSTLESIGESAFFSCGRLSAVSLPDGLVSIGKAAFYGCNALTDVRIPGSVTEWGDYAFSHCESLRVVTVGEGVTRVPDRSFICNKALERVELPSSVTSVGHAAFRGCKALEACNLSGVTEVGSLSFSGTALAEANLASALSVGDEAFAGDSALATLDLSSVCKIGEKSFGGCSSLGTVCLPATLTDLGLDAFAGAARAFEVDAANPSLSASGCILYSKDGSELLFVPSQMEFPDGTLEVAATVRSIAAHAASSQANIVRLVLPEGLEQMGEGAFLDSSVSEIELPQGLTEIAPQAFKGTALTRIVVPGSVELVGEEAFAGCMGLSEAVLLEGVREVGPHAFAGCRVGELALPASLEVLDPTALAGNNVRGIVVAEANASLRLADDGASLLSADGKTLLGVYGVSGDDQGNKPAYAIPEGVEAVAPNACCLVDAASVTVPDSVAAIGEGGIGFNDYYIRTRINYELTVYGGQGNEALLDYAKKTGLAFFTAEPARSATSASLEVGQSFAYSLAGAPEGLLCFASSDGSVARVDEDGTVTAVGAGEADVFACVGRRYFPVHVTVGGPVAADPYEGYARISSSEEVKPWADAYARHNGAKTLREDIPNVFTYTTDYYKAMNAFLIGGSYIREADEAFGAGQYDEYRLAALDACDELLRNSLHVDTVLYSGTDDVSYITGAGSTIEDLVASVGREWVSDGIVSTSLLQSVAAKFTGNGAFPTMLEIYAPASKTKGTYVAESSSFEEEYEVTFPRGQRMRVVDAGVRWSEYLIEGNEGLVPHREMQRFVKLEVIGDPEPEPDPDPTPVDPSPEDPEPNAPGADSGGSRPAAERGSGAAGVPDTGELSGATQATLAFGGLLALLVAAGRRRRA